jgi:hypothetical protein
MSVPSANAVVDMTMGFGAGAAGDGGACALAVTASADRVVKIKNARTNRIGFTLPEFVVILNRVRALKYPEKNEE